MQTYEIPRNYKGESRILYIFSTKALMYTAVGLVIGLVFYFILNACGMQMIGFACDAIVGAIGFAIGTFKIPDNKKFEFAKKTGGENIDDVAKRWIKFKKKRNRVYIWKEEETKDE